MCTYCMMGDHIFKYIPPWLPAEYPPYNPGPFTPSQPFAQPLMPPNPLDPTRINLPLYKDPPWDIERLKEVLDLLQQIKAMEDKLGCPCEPSKKMDYIDMFKKRIEYLEAQKGDSPQENT